MDQGDSTPQVESVHPEGPHVAVGGRATAGECANKKPERRVSALDRWKRLMNIIDQ